ncbi:hypothetical protein Y032_0001g58 [Ancylostoma ceylanicum]|uniref:Uncharacterized protein n=1 Tax=Ancylostoma ceylanicum TaxID=53326 RepID=A0A016W6K4_9BILA|nr:hypothetical protein Y032_0001g58 [Ancylostoma ceylanicum]
MFDVYAGPGPSLPNHRQMHVSNSWLLFYPLPSYEDNYLFRFNYTCPEPTHAYAWPVKGNGPIAVSGELECNGPDYTWRIRKYGVTEKIACMSRPQTSWWIVSRNILVKSK